MWILFSKRPLSMPELCQALTIPKDDFDALKQEAQLDHNNNSGISSSLESAAYTPGFIIQACAGLVIVDELESTLSFPHYSVYEYFAERRGKLFPHGSRQIAIACVRYLISEPFEIFETVEEEDSVDTFRNHPFLDYAAHHWVLHTREKLNDEVSRDEE
jgi:hypothetical protein